MAEVLTLGLRAAWYDVCLDDVGMDLLSVQGFANAILLALSLCVGGVAWFGVPCSTFVHIAMGHTKRSWRRPLGNERREDVRMANKIVDRLVFILEILVLRSVYFLIEQPLTSVLWWIPALRQFVLRRPRVLGKRCQRRFLWLGHFGHRLLKPTVLVGVFPGLVSSPLLATQKPMRKKKGKTGVYSEWTNRWGKRRFAGSKRLKATGVYPEGFARVMASLVCAVVRATEREPARF